MLLLDTCTLLWLVSDRGQLSPAAASAIDQAREVFVSSVSAFEIGTKYRQGKLPLALAPRDWWAAASARLELTELPITAQVAFASTSLPTQLVVEGRTVDHRDPGDRFIVATASLHGLAIVTPDAKIAAYPGASVCW
jgi:PIN domain nuclease of toxin-antitoxin system